MKAKKRERQERERKQREEAKKIEFYDNLPIVTLRMLHDHVVQYERTFTWDCTYCRYTFTYSQKINDLWGHPHHLAFCAVCCKYHKIDIQASGLKLAN